VGGEAEDAVGDGDGDAGCEEGALELDDGDAVRR
jgi:hypothetical protein